MLWLMHTMKCVVNIIQAHKKERVTHSLHFTFLDLLNLHKTSYIRDVFMACQNGTLVSR